jgi:conjugal transfer/entry exclusion protein
MKQIIANFLRKLIKLDDYIEDRVFTDIERLEREIEVVNELTDSNGVDLNDRPTFYDMESQVEQLVSDWVNDALQDIDERLKKLEDK